MKTWDDIVKRTRTELDGWFVLQCHNIFNDYYVWYKPSSANVSGDLIISDRKPGDKYELARPEKLDKGKTVEQNFMALYDILRRLPILDVA